MKNQLQYLATGKVNQGEPVIEVQLNSSHLGYIQKQENQYYCFYKHGNDFDEIELCSKELDDLQMQLADKFILIANA